MIFYLEEKHFLCQKHDISRWPDLSSNVLKTACCNKSGVSVSTFNTKGFNLMRLLPQRSHKIVSLHFVER